MEKRSANDIHRNAMVSIFLRLLERHQGVMFLTTNRMENIDEAFRSRISTVIEYKHLDEAKRSKVWHNLLKAANISLSEDNINELVKKNINGRTIHYSMVQVKKNENNT
jgi:AAA+ superfamily predicted ATPase